MTDLPRSNGHADLEDDDLDDDAPLDPDEAAAAMAVALEDSDDSLDERVGAVAEGLDRVDAIRDGDAVMFQVDGVPFARLAGETLEVRLEDPVAQAALRTADTAASARGGGWIAFTPRMADRFALDRAEAWIRSAHRHATSG